MLGVKKELENIFNGLDDALYINYNIKVNKNKSNDMQQRCTGTTFRYKS